MARASQVGTFRRIIQKVRYGLVFQVLRNKLYSLGIEITPFYLTQLGVDIKEEPELKDQNGSYHCGFLDEQDLVGLGDRVRGYSTDKLLSNLRDGRKCFGIKNGDQVAALMWIDLKECNFKPCKFPLEKNEAYTFSVYTMEEYRGLNVAPVMAVNCYRELNSMGINKIYSITEYFNKSAIRYKMKLGPKKLKLYLYLGFFKRYYRLFLLRTYS